MAIIGSHRRHVRGAGPQEREARRRRLLGDLVRPLQDGRARDGEAGAASTRAPSTSSRSTSTRTPAISQAFQIMSIPTIAFFRPGQQPRAWSASARSSSSSSSSVSSSTCPRPRWRLPSPPDPRATIAAADTNAPVPPGRLNSAVAARLAASGAGGAQAAVSKSGACPDPRPQLPAAPAAVSKSMVRPGSSQLPAARQALVIHAARRSSTDGSIAAGTKRTHSLPRPDGVVSGVRSTASATSARRRNSTAAPIHNGEQPGAPSQLEATVRARGVDLVELGCDVCHHGSEGFVRSVAIEHRSLAYILSSGFPCGFRRRQQPESGNRTAGRCSTTGGPRALSLETQGQAERQTVRHVGTPWRRPRGRRPDPPVADAMPVDRRRSRAPRRCFASSRRTVSSTDPSAVLISTTNTVAVDTW